MSNRYAASIAKPGFQIVEFLPQGFEFLLETP
jgi:hypothetical protein